MKTQQTSLTILPFDGERPLPMQECEHCDVELLVALPTVVPSFVLINNSAKPVQTELDVNLSRVFLGQELSLLQPGIPTLLKGEILTRRQFGMMSPWEGVFQHPIWASLTIRIYDPNLHNLPIQIEQEREEEKIVPYGYELNKLPENILSKDYRTEFKEINSPYPRRGRDDFGFEESPLSLLGFLGTVPRQQWELGLLRTIEIVIGTQYSLMALSHTFEP